MSRRRYLSTNISIDRKVNQLAVDYGDFAALLYTWMIPHAGDDGTLTSDPEELLLMVTPGRRDKTAPDIEHAVGGMVVLGLLIRHETTIQFPGESFYKYQTYVTEQRRSPKLGTNSAAPSIKDVALISAQNSANQRKSENCADIAASSSSSSSSSFKSSSSFELTDVYAADAAACTPETESQINYPSTSAEEYQESGPAATKPVDTSQVAAIFGEYRRAIQMNATLTDGARRKITTRLRSFTPEQIQMAIEHFSADNWEMENNAHRGAAWWFATDDRTEQYMNLKPRQSTRASPNGTHNPAAARFAGIARTFDDDEDPVADAAEAGP